MFLLVMKGGHGDCFLDVRQAGNLRSGSFELKRRYFLLTAEPLNEWSPDRIKAAKPPVGRRLFSRVSLG